MIFNINFHVIYINFVSYLLFNLKNFIVKNIVYMYIIYLNLYFIVNYYYI